MKTRLLLFGMILLAGFPISCKKNKVEVVPTPDIYVSGQDWIGKNNLYWKNGTLHNYLTRSDPSSMVVSGGDIYFISGYGYSKNDVQFYLPTAKYLTDIFISGEDIYAVGVSDNTKGAVYWKNNQRVKLDPNDSTKEAKAIAVSNGKIYIAGTDGTNIFYWHDNTFFSLGAGKFNKMQVVGSDIYILGRDSNNQNAYWINNVKYNLYSDQGMSVTLRDMYIDGTDIYFLGTPNVSNPGVDEAIVWKNGRPFSNNLSEYPMSAKSITVHNNDVYVIGDILSSQRKSFIWKNGTVDTLDMEVASKIIVE